MGGRNFYALLKTPVIPKGVWQEPFHLNPYIGIIAERAADILVDENWDDRKNDKGYAGTSFSRGVAGHGGLSPYEVHIALLAAGPSFKKNFSSELPTSNVDIAPTILAIHNLTIPTSMDGRVLYELLIDNKNKVKGKGQEGTAYFFSTVCRRHVYPYASSNYFWRHISTLILPK